MWGRGKGRGREGEGKKGAWLSVCHSFPLRSTFLFPPSLGSFVFFLLFSGGLQGAHVPFCHSFPPSWLNFILFFSSFLVAPFSSFPSVIICQQTCIFFFFLVCWVPLLSASLQAKRLFRDRGKAEQLPEKRIERQLFFPSLPPPPEREPTSANRQLETKSRNKRHEGPNEKAIDPRARRQPSPRSLYKPPIMVYVRQRELPALKDYKYSGVDRSLLSKYVLKPFYTNVVIKCFPLSMAPNLITLTGFLFVVANFLTLLWYNPTLDQDCPSWVYYSWALGLFLYQTFDAVDGTQA